MHVCRNQWQSKLKPLQVSIFFSKKWKLWIHIYPSWKFLKDLIYWWPISQVQIKEKRNTHNFSKADQWRKDTVINIASFKVLKGYEHWKTVFMDEAFVKRREEAGVKVLAKGFDAQNDRVYVIQELDSMEVIQNAMAKNQEKIMEAGVDMSTMQMIPLQDWFKKRFFPGLENQNEEFGEKESHFNQGSNFTKEAIIEKKIVIDVISSNILKSWRQSFNISLKNKSLEDLV